MRLYVNGQDISRIILADVDSGEMQTVETETEGFLEAIDTFVKKRVGDCEDIQALYVVVGPGSATALRSTLSIAQTIHFVTGVKLYAIEKDQQEDDQVTLPRIEKEAKEVKRLIPVYQHQPRITISNKDALGRSA